MGLERELVWRRPICFCFLLRGLYDGTQANSGRRCLSLFECSERIGRLIYPSRENRAAEGTSVNLRHVSKSYHLNSATRIKRSP